MHNTGLLGRLAAILYDALLLFAVMMLGTLPFIIIRGGEPVEPGNMPYQAAMLVVAYLFFTLYWSRAGRTLGMQAWRLRGECEDGTTPGFGTASLRFFAALVSWLPAGLGFLWQLWDRDRLTWHDRMSGTRLRHYPKSSKNSGDEKKR